MTEKRLADCDPSLIKSSPFNTRRSRPDDDVSKLADRMRKNGFEKTRAPWVHMLPSGELAAFAGGTRVAAACAAGLATIPVWVHDGIADDELARLADEDNENDEYHRPVPIVDVWAEYHRLAKECGWQQKRIAEAKRASPSLVSERIKWHESLCEAARKATSSGLFDEAHLREISIEVLSLELSMWLTSQRAQAELVTDVLGKHRGSSTGVKPSVTVVRETAKRWKALIASAETAYAALEEPWAAQFVKALADSKARSGADVSMAVKRIVDSQRKAADAAAVAARRALSESEAAAQKLADEQLRLASMESLISRVQRGDARDLIRLAPNGIKLMLTDPPYGMEFQSGRRVITAKKSKIENDGLDDALSLLKSVLASAIDKMAQDAHLLVFTGWRHEPAFRAVVESAGFAIKGSLVWVKNNHGTGDLKGSFAPKHERIIHAVKGSPELVMRIPDVVYGKDAQNSEHPTEKPRELLKQLIESTTRQGDVVVDPFAGSGNTLLEAHELGRDFWGCELDESYHRKIVDMLTHVDTMEAA